VMTHSTPPQTIDNPHMSRRPRQTRMLLAATLLAGALGLAACSSSGSSTATTAAPATATTGSSASTGTTGTEAITIKNFAFAPSSITVAPESSVTVTNKDQVAHTVTSSKGGFDTGDIQPGQSKTITAPKTPGSYPYICSIHQYMTGTLVVSG
jgi:plastocyanin